MFALHETTQRRVCRVIFLMLCVVPTLLTLAGIAYCNRPWRQADWQQTLASRLHVRAELDDISRPRPGQTVLTNLKLADLRSNQTLGTIGKLKFQRQDSQLKLQADHLEIQAQQLPDFAAAISTWLATGEIVPLDFHAEKLTILGESLRSVSFHGFSISSVPSDSAGQRFRVSAQKSSGEVVEMVLEHEQGNSRLEIKTQNSSLPAWLIGKFVPGVAGCGEAAFTGTVTAESSRQATHGNLQGTFQQIDLQQWIGLGPHRLQGEAKLQMEMLSWSDGRIEVARGRLNVGSGVISNSLLLNAQELCGCTTPGLQPGSQGVLQPFDELAVRFQLSESGVAFAGLCEGDTLITKGQEPLLLLPQREMMLPVGRLVRLLNHLEEPGWLPATRRAYSMAEQLPLPGDKTE